MAISKKFHEIKTFNSGIMAKPDDERDGPESAAVISLNVESLASGELRGIPKDVVLLHTSKVVEYLPPLLLLTIQQTTLNNGCNSNNSV